MITTHVHTRVTPACARACVGVMPRGEGLLWP